MKFLSIALFSGALLMASSSDSIRIEPGKQLPQSLKIHVDGKPTAGDATMRYMLFAPKDYKYDARGRRDPFVNPVPKPAASAGPAAPVVRPPGLKGVLMAVYRKITDR